MKPEEYLEKILQKEGLSKDSQEVKAMQEEKANVEKIISDTFESNPVVRYAGSYKKETMIKASYDLDITCYFKHDDDSAGDNLEDIFNNVKKAFENKYFVVPKKSALRLQSTDKKLDFHIDVVPGRFVDDSESDAFLYQSTGDKNRLKTNLDVHISHIKDSGLVKIIKLAKIWKSIYLIDVKTFVLELLVVKVLDDKKDKDGLDNCLKAFFEELSSNIDNIAVEDPANSGNDLSLLFDSYIKDALSGAASKAKKLIEEDKWEELFGPVDDDNKSNKASFFSESQNQTTGPKPWLDI